MSSKLPVKLMLIPMVLGVFTPGAYADCRRVFVRHNPVVVVEKPVIKAVAAVVEFVTPVLPIYTVPPAYGAYYIPPVAHAAHAAPPAHAPADPCADLRLKFAELQKEVQFMRQQGQYQPPRTAPGRGAQPPQGPNGNGPGPGPGAGPGPMSKAENGDDGGNDSNPGPAPPPQPQTEPRGQGEQPGKGEQPGGPQTERGGGFAAWASTKGGCVTCHSGANVKRDGGGFTLLTREQGKWGLAELTPEKTGEVILRLSLPRGHGKAMPKGKNLTPAELMEGINLFVKG